MRSSIIMAVLTVGFWLGQLVLSFHEKTFSRRQRRVKMSFLWNWSVSVGGLVIFPVINGLIAGNINIDGAFYLKYIGAMAFGFFISFVLHRLWWGRNENLGHVFPNWEKSEKEPNLW